MPELPEVQTIVDELSASGVVGAQIRRARVYWPKTIATSSPQWFSRQVRNRRIEDIGRRAKYIIFKLSGGLYWVVHLRMTGRFELVESNSPRVAHEHVIVDLIDHRQLKFHDTRKFGRFYLTKELQTITGHLGPEPLEEGFTPPKFEKMLKARRRQIKPLLLDQKFLSGLGNIYVDESLWCSRIHPQRTADTLDRREIESLHACIQAVLRQAIGNEGTSLGTGLGNYTGPNRRPGGNSVDLNVFRKTGQPCPRCAKPIGRIVVGQRGSHFCPGCQKK